MLSMYILQEKRNFLNTDPSKYFTRCGMMGVASMQMKTKAIFNVFFREKPSLMLVVLKNAKQGMYASSLAKQVDCTYSHVVKILQQMEKAGLINFDKKGRLKLLSLTKKGQEIAEHIDQAMISL